MQSLPQVYPNEFTFVIIPDVHVDGKCTVEQMRYLGDWIINHADKLNIRYVAQLGDVGYERRGKLAETLMSCRKALQPIIDNNIPFSVAIGNHDYLDGSSRRNAKTGKPERESAATFNGADTFGRNFYKGKKWFGGTFEEEVEEPGINPGGAINHYLIKEIKGKKFLFLALEYFPRDKVMKWASNLVEHRYPDHNVVVITHAYLNEDGELAEERYKTGEGSEHSNSGKEMWEKYFKNWKKLRFILNGHYINPEGPRQKYLAQKGVHGNIVHTHFVNYQNWAYMDGKLVYTKTRPGAENTQSAAVRIFAFDLKKNKVRIMNFLPEANIDIEPAKPTEHSFIIDSNAHETSSRALSSIKSQKDDTTPITLVKDHSSSAVVVLPDKPKPIQKFAAQELIYHIFKSTGVKLPLYHESDVPSASQSRIYLGDCAATKKAGIESKSMQPSNYIVRTKKNMLFLVGKDCEFNLGDTQKFIDGSDIWHSDLGCVTLWCGTLYAVYDFLETEMGVRWLWPGELGEEIPKASDLVVKKINHKGGPRFRHTWLYPAGAKARYAQFGWRSSDSRDAFYRAQRLFMIRHRFGATVENFLFGHRFQGYWQRFGNTNPEFFSKLPDGTRRPLRGRPEGTDISLCVSEPTLWKQIVKDWQKKGNKTYINACENDTPGMCTCERCRSWDAADPGFRTSDYWGKKIIPENSRRFTLARTPWGELNCGESVVDNPPSLSDRYARYYMNLLKEARKVTSKAKLIGYAYANYWKAPKNLHGDLDLDGTVIEYVPAIGFPYTKSMVNEFCKNWYGWEKLGAKMVLRPNITHDGANLPIFYARQLADIFSYAAKHGMVGTAFDSLLGAWSAQGPTMYVLARIHEHPDWPVDKILDEYYSAFGPAEAGVRAYFDYWERHSNALNPEEVLRYKKEEQGGGFKNYIRIAHRLFRPEDFKNARKLLNKAQRQAEGNPIAIRRVAYLEQGLTDAELTTATRAAQSKLERQNSKENRVAFEKTFKKLLDYRTRIEACGEFSVNIGYFAFREQFGSDWPYKKYESKKSSNAKHDVSCK